MRLFFIKKEVKPLKLFNVGDQFPDDESIPRIARYIRGKYYFEGKQAELVERATNILKDTPHAEKLALLHIGFNMVQALTNKPADLMFGEPPNYQVSEDETAEQEALERIVEANELNTMGHELVVSSGIRGDGWLKVFYDYREDYSELLSMGLPIPDEVEPEVIIEPVPANFVFPETANLNNKKFKAINICYVSYQDRKKRSFLSSLGQRITGIGDEEEVPYLNVERHIPGYIFYERYKLAEKTVSTEYGANIQLFDLIEQVSTGRENDIVETGLNHIPVHHVPYSACDDTWTGHNNIENIESLITAIEDRLVQIDYILWKHSDPNAYGPPAGVAEIKSGGRYIPLEAGEVTPGYMEWNSQLEAAFRELDRLIGMVFAIQETPQWLFGSAITELESGGTGTSHTDGAAIKSRFMPILSKVKRIRVYLERAIKKTLYSAMQLEQVARGKYETSIPEYEPKMSTILWKDGLPNNDKEIAEIMALRTGNKPTIDQLTAIKVLENMNFDQSKAIYEAMKAEQEEALKQLQEQMNPSVDLNWNDEPKAPSQEKSSGES